VLRDRLRALKPFEAVVGALAMLCLALAVFYRLYALGRLPGINGDEAWYGVQLQRYFDGVSMCANALGAQQKWDDIIALQYLYGANYQYNSGNTVYRWSPTTGETFINGVGQGATLHAKIFLTIWDGGGIDTYDFSNYGTNAVIDLAPGAWSTPTARSWAGWRPRSRTRCAARTSRPTPRTWTPATS
jgi:hypothetical protein